MTALFQFCKENLIISLLIQKNINDIIILQIIFKKRYRGRYGKKKIKIWLKRLSR